MFQGGEKALQAIWEGSIPLLSTGFVDFLKIDVYGERSVVVSAWLFVKQKVGVRFPSFTLMRMLDGITSTLFEK